VNRRNKRKSTKVFLGEEGLKELAGSRIVNPEAWSNPPVRTPFLIKLISSLCREKMLMTI